MSCDVEDVLQHLGRQLARVRVLAARVIRGDQGGYVGSEVVDEAVTECRARPGFRAAGCQERQARVERDAAERDQHADARERIEFGGEVRTTRSDFPRRRFVVGWRAPNGGGDVRVVKDEAVRGIRRNRLVREPRFVHRAHQEAARAIPGEHPACSVGAVRRGREADDQQPGGRVAEAGHRSSPVDFVAVRGLLLGRHPFAVPAQPPATLTVDDMTLNLGKIHGSDRQVDRAREKTARPGSMHLAWGHGMPGPCVGRELVKPSAAGFRAVAGASAGIGRPSRHRRSDGRSKASPSSGTRPSVRRPRRPVSGELPRRRGSRPRAG